MRLPLKRMIYFFSIKDSPNDVNNICILIASLNKTSLKYIGSTLNDKRLCQPPHFKD